MTEKSIPQSSSFSESGTGVAVDAHGGPVIDPTKNVIDLTNAAVRRQDDLRIASEKYVESRLAHLEELSRIRSEHVAILSHHETGRIDAMRDSQLQHVEQMARLRADHTTDLLRAEASRINAIREVDVGSVATANERAQQQAVVLANQVATSAETLRALVASTNAAVATAMTNMSTQFSERLGLLEKASNIGLGKGEVSDPRLVGLYEEMRRLNQSSDTKSGSGAGMSHLWLIIVAAISAVGVIVMMFEKLAK